MSNRRPPPLVPPHVDVSDLPLPREAFIEMAISQFGVDRAEATRLVNARADEIEAQQRKRRGH